MPSGSCLIEHGKVGCWKAVIAEKTLTIPVGWDSMLITVEDETVNQVVLARKRWQELASVRLS